MVFELTINEIAQVAGSGYKSNIDASTSMSIDSEFKELSWLIYGIAGFTTMFASCALGIFALFIRHKLDAVNNYQLLLLPKSSFQIY